MTASFSAKNFGSFNVRPPAVGAGQRIGLLGGSFNPAHEGHRHISDFAIKSCRLDKVWWLVTPGNPIKSHTELPTLESRIKSATKIADHPRMIVTGFEAALPTSFTADTLKFLTRRYSATRFIWLMGADNLANFHRWQNWRTIFQTVPIAVFDRPEYRLKAISSPAAQRFSRYRKPATEAASLIGAKLPAWTFLTLPLSDLSSTKLRHL